MGRMITYVSGDATSPRGTGPALIAHICNDRGGWGAGFVLALSRRWAGPERAYRTWFRTGSFDGYGGVHHPFELGQVQLVEVDTRPIFVANMIAQVGYGPKNMNQHRSADEEDEDIPLRYDALETCLTKVAEVAETHGASIHMPRLGCALAGGRWSKVGPLIEKTLADCSVTVYDFGPYNP